MSTSEIKIYLNILSEMAKPFTCVVYERIFEYREQCESLIG